jgi:hypothetical protein
MKLSMFLVAVLFFGALQAARAEEPDADLKVMTRLAYEMRDAQEHADLIRYVQTLLPGGRDTEFSLLLRIRALRNDVRRDGMCNVAADLQMKFKDPTQIGGYDDVERRCNEARHLLKTHKRTNALTESDIVALQHQDPAAYQTRADKAARDYGALAISRMAHAAVSSSARGE